MAQEPSRTEIWKMFDRISSTYDLVNRVMTCGLDRYWRKKMGSLLPKKENLRLLDLATGTADQIISLLENTPHISEAVGIDLSQEMLNVGKVKLQSKPYAHRVMMQEASAMEIPYADHAFDCATITFGIRNVSDVGLCLKEIRRVLKPGGRLLILEGSLPRNVFLKKLHLLYLRHLMPHLGGWISRNKEAYVYLNQTIETFPSGETFCHLLSQAGFIQTKAHPLSGGIVTIYSGDTP